MLDRIAACFLLCSLAFSASASSTSGSSTSTPAADQVVLRHGDGWHVARQGSHYQVVLTHPTPLPVRAAHPALLIDGQSQRAQLSRDRRRLSVPIDPAQAGRIQTVTLPASWAGRRGAQARAVPVPAVPPSRPRGAQIGNPAEKGPFAVARWEYDFGDEALEIEGMDIASELRAAVYLPNGGGTALPLVMFMHGAHPSCHEDRTRTGTRGFDDDAFEPGQAAWPCPPGYRATPSYRGYDGPAEALASHGYAVVSVSANALLAADEDAWGSNRESLWRARLLSAHLEVLELAHAGELPSLSPLAGRLDLQRIGLMGHSRGGEGMAHAVLLNAAGQLRTDPHAFKALFLLAPTAASDALASLPDVPMAVLLPYCDGDVYTLEGQDYIDRSRPAFADNVLRTRLLAMGSNHNFFNTVWSPGTPTGLDDALGLGGACAPQARLNPSQQQALGAVYIAGFFRMTLGGEERFLPLFDGSGSGVAGLPSAEVRGTAAFPAAARYDLLNFDGWRRHGRGADSVWRGWDWSVNRLQGRGGWHGLCTAWYGCQDGFDFEQAMARLFPDAEAKVPHEGGFLYFDGLSPSFAGRATVILRGAGPANPLDYTHLSFQVGRAGAGEAPLRLWAGLAGRAPESRWPDAGDERAGSIPPHLVWRAVSPSFALEPLPVMATPWQEAVHTIVQQGVSVPLAAFPAHAVRELSAVALTLESEGGVLLSNVALVRPAVGEGGPSRLPWVQVEDVVLPPADRQREVRVRVRLSRPAEEPVVLRISPLLGAGDARLVFARGVQERSLRLNVRPQRAGACPLVVTEVRNAFVTASRSVLRVGEDNVGLSCAPFVLLD